MIHEHCSKCITDSFALSVHSTGGRGVVSAVGGGTSGSGTGSAAWLSQSTLGVDGDSSSLGLSLGFVECFLIFLCFRCGECVLEDALEVLRFLRILLHSFFLLFLRLRFFRGCFRRCCSQRFR